MLNNYIHWKRLINRTRPWTLYSAIFLLVIGLFLFLLNFIHNDRYNWKPVQVPIRIKAGEVVEGRFVAEIDGAYEIEFEFQNRIPEKQIQKIIKPVEKPSPLEIEWTVSHNSEIIAKGNCHDYLYVEDGGTSPSELKQIGWRIFNLPYRQNPTSKIITTIRGVGRSKCKKGLEYTVVARVNKTFELLEATNPTLGIRINRPYSIQFIRETKSYVACGLIALGTAILLFTWWSVSPAFSINKKLIPFIMLFHVLLGCFIFWLLRLTYMVVY